LKALPVEPSNSGYRYMKEYYDKIKQFKKQLKGSVKEAKNNNL